MKTSYILQYSFDFDKLWKYGKFGGNGWNTVGSAKEATQYASVADALRDVNKATSHGPGFYLRIVKLEEKPGVETRRELGEAEQAKSGETVKYAIGGWAKYAKPEEGSANDLVFFTGIENAALYASQAEAVRALITNALKKGENVYLDATVVRIAASNQPTVTETVLS